MVTWVVLNCAQNYAIMVTWVVPNCAQNYAIMVTWVVPNCAQNYAIMVTYFHGQMNNESLLEHHSTTFSWENRMREAPRSSKAKCPNNQHALKSEPTNQTPPFLLSGKHKKGTSLRTCRK
jgi:hypothetical protein